MPDRTAFTLGYDLGYDSSLAVATRDDPVIKRGAREGYRGGWVWGTAEAARLFRFSTGFGKSFPGRDAAEFAVYRLELPTGWDEDVSEPDEDGVCHLRTDAVVVERWDAA